ncbi:Hypothetical predicted protein [Pelobates cultripes]|uniref:Uncharacterized protein n=1 Tax=Pelobates cultripes TaxID=61616 RepID=A0AAD1W3W7_PELCU|nr:Hypothetical predicted protein [Pelobates cultripes]
MGCRSQKLQLGPSKESHDIGDMLQCHTASKMAARLENGANRPEPSAEPTTPGDTLTSTTLLEAMADQDPLAPATKQDIANLLWEVRQMLVADLHVVRNEVQVVSARTQAKEAVVQELKQEMQEVKNQMHSLTHSHTSLTQRVDLSEDCKRHANIKLRGIPDTIDQAVLPHYLRQTHSYLILRPKKFS